VMHIGHRNSVRHAVRYVQVPLAIFNLECARRFVRSVTRRV